MDHADNKPNANLEPDLLDRLQAHLQQQPEIDAAYLFGSRATGRAGEDSDVDVALLLAEDVDLEEDPMYRLRQLAALETLSGQRVDVVILNQAPLVLINQVLTTGELIFERNHHRRVRFEVRSLLAYFDFKPMLDRLNRKLAQDIKEGRIATRYRGHRDPLDDARRAFERLESAKRDNV